MSGHMPWEEWALGPGTLERTAFQEKYSLGKKGMATSVPGGSSGES